MKPSNTYDLTTARGGKYDAAIQKALTLLLPALHAGSRVVISPSVLGGNFTGTDLVHIHLGQAVFVNRNDHTWVPAPVKAAVRVLHSLNFLGHFEIEVSQSTLTIRPSAGSGKASGSGPSTGPAAPPAPPGGPAAPPIRPAPPAPGSRSPSLSVATDDSLWKTALADPLPLFRTAANDPLLAVFDGKGFFLSDEAQPEYDGIKSLPHIYIARLESENAYYFGISNQSGGRWKRSHAYHLGGLAHEILDTKRYDDQDHSNWVRAWFQAFQEQRSGRCHAIGMRERIIISFLVPKPPASKRQLEAAESRLIAMARKRGLVVLNKRG
jgi:hypothetical protein